MSDLITVMHERAERVYEDWRPAGSKFWNELHESERWSWVRMVEAVRAPLLIESVLAVSESGEEVTT